jgi:hypothetical protein
MASIAVWPVPDAKLLRRVHVWVALSDNALNVLDACGPSKDVPNEV